MKPETAPGSEQNSGARRWQVGDALIDEQRQSLTLNGTTCSLTNLTWRFLLTLIEAAPGIADHQALARGVWQRDEVPDETLAQRVRQLRRDLGDDSRSPTYVRTVRGQGYQLIPSATLLDDDAGDNQRHVTPRTIVFAGLVLVTAIGLALWLRMVNTSDAGGGSLAVSHSAGVDELVARAASYKSRGRPDANDTAIALYRQALEIDIDNIDALIGLSIAYSHRPSKYGQSLDWATTGADVADRALQLEPANSRAWSARGLADDARGWVGNAINYYRRALALDGDNQDARSSLAFLLQVRGELDEALRFELHALRAAPATYFADLQISRALYLLGLDQSSARWFERAAQLRPDSLFLIDDQARRLLVTGEPAQAAALLDANSAHNFYSTALRAEALLLAGRDEDAAAAFAVARAKAASNGRVCHACEAYAISTGAVDSAVTVETVRSQSQTAIAGGDEWPGFRVDLAYVYAAAGETDAALQSLRDARTLGYRDWRWLQATPLLRAVHDDAGFQALISRMRNDLAVQRAAIESDVEFAELLR